MLESMQQTVDVLSCIRRYPWIIEMVKSKLFHEICDQHDTQKKRRCYFCCDCMIPPFCTTCYKKNDHKGHTLIQTYRSSYQTGVKKETMSKYMDISGIHIYSINGFPIVYINQRRGNDNHRFRNNVMHKCQVCEWELDAASSALFCSMECKFRSVLGSQLDELMENSEITENSEETDELVKKKRHRRKGSPHRAPFF
ncbi:unnamed protein product [Arabidopsis lyrata]|uniref:uncharacterized protein At3g50808 n=1 Tax=Arabidopsis lyrata subsp. lyrata TaxID=81972 RepID=UPI000A29DD0F|nr:uncharacterized protein At3g50808 [Arabidopsis lyrata subsp. lyrata]CAH8268179.1 unnamed protein product [Arabidopsis lyrata]|eukprot:XP_020882599.1 uncharacterized protein At3g50808 [Arabidopsis lyrata subsp. lyrata]